MKKLKLFLAASFILGMVTINVFWATSQNDSEKFLGRLLGVNIEALANDTELVPTDPPSPPEERLKKEDCTCSDNTTQGFTLKCSSKGKLEKCTPTQQGSNACYTVSIWNQEMKLCKEN